MSWNNCNLIFHWGTTGFVYAGDIVTGSVVLEFTEEQKVESVQFKVKGKSKAQWSRSKPTVPYIKIYSGKKKELEMVVDVFPDLEGRTAPGIYNHVFHFVLPENIPPSFKSSIASIHYYIKVEGKSVNRSKKKKIIPFTVRRNLNLNHLEEFLNPLKVEFRKIIWNSGNFIVKFETYKGIFTTQDVPFNILIQNEKKVKISKFIVALMQKRRYTLPSGYFEDETEICKREYKTFLSTVQEHCQFYLHIPQIIVSSINLTETLIGISYFLRVQVHFPFHVNMIEDVPVMIASVPLIYKKLIQI